MIVRKRNNTIEISFQYKPELVSFIKTLEGRKYIPATRNWCIPLAGAHASVQLLARRGFRIEPEVYEAVRQDQEAASEAEALAVMEDVEFTTTLPLFPYQKVGAAFLHRVGSGLLGDEPGAGKTLQTLALVEHGRGEHVLVFCPAVLKHQWAAEIVRFLPEARVVIVEGDAKERIKCWRSEAQYYIANYELLLRDMESMNVREWDYILADECTRVQNPSAKQSKNLKKLRARHRIAMSGTPISNAAQNIWSIVDWTNPGVLGSYWDFLGRYCLKDRWGGIFAYQNMDELRGKLRRYMIRRLKKDILPELPERIEVDIPFVLSEEEAALQKKIKMEILHEITAADINKLATPMTLQFTIVKFARLRQLADSLELLGENTKSSKLEVLRELLEQFKDTDTKILIFSEFSEMCKILQRELAEYNPVMIVGEVANEDRQPLLDRFNDDPTIRICILSSAGQYGLNITAASVVVNYDLPFSLAKLEQRIGRAHRYGQKRNVMVYNLLGKGTADMGIRRILHSKASLSDAVLGDTPVNMEELKKILQYE